MRKILNLLFTQWRRGDGGARSKRVDRPLISFPTLVLVKAGFKFGKTFLDDLQLF